MDTIESIDERRRRRKWNSLKQSLSWTAAIMGCCGGGRPWQPKSSSTTIIDILAQPQDDDDYDDNDGPSRMNLATALAAERNLRSAEEAAAATMRLIIEEETERGGEVLGRSDWVCCVCMQRNKGAAFIPCGHALCRVCSREVWLTRSSCPLCNRSILDILQIF